MCVYQSPALTALLERGFSEIGKKASMGKSCIRFQTTDEIHVKIIGKIIRSVSLKDFIAAYEEVKGK